MQRRARLLHGVVLGAAALLIAGCGGDNDTADPPPVPVTTDVPATQQVTTLPPTTSGLSATTSISQRTPVSTTLPPVPGETMIDREMVPEKTTDFTVGQSRINGVSYSNAIIIYSPRSPGRIEIDAARNRKRFLGVLGIPDDQRSSSSHQVDISLDNGPTVFSAVVNFGETKNIELDVTGALRIRVLVTNKSPDGSTAYVAIGNPRFA